MTENTVTGHLDADGDEFKDGAHYLDRHGDTWRYSGALDEFRLVKLVGQAEPLETSPTVIARYEGAAPLARDYGPMTKVTEAAR